MTSGPSQRAVVLLRRGPRWDDAKPLIEQEGVHDHLAYLGELQREGVLERGGPFHRPSELVAGQLVGMLVYAADRERAGEYGRGDPAVKTGLLVYEALPWYA